MDKRIISHAVTAIIGLVMGIGVFNMAREMSSVNTDGNGVVMGFQAIPFLVAVLLFLAVVREVIAIVKCLKENTGSTSGEIQWVEDENGQMVQVSGAAGSTDESLNKMEKVVDKGSSIVSQVSKIMFGVVFAGVGIVAITQGQNQADAMTFNILGGIFTGAGALIVITAVKAIITTIKNP